MSNRSIKRAKGAVYEVDVTDGQQTLKLLFDNLSIAHSAAREITALGFTCEVLPGRRRIEPYASDAVLTTKMFFAKM